MHTHKHTVFTASRPSRLFLHTHTLEHFYNNTHTHTLKRACVCARTFVCSVISENLFLCMLFFTVNIINTHTHAQALEINLWQLRSTTHTHTYTHIHTQMCVCVCVGVCVWARVCVILYTHTHNRWKLIFDSYDQKKGRKSHFAYVPCKKKLCAQKIHQKRRGGAAFLFIFVYLTFLWWKQQEVAAGGRRFCLFLCT